jgi:hypothetical protein
MKLQSANGSMDEKYQYILLNVIYQYQEKESVFLVDGVLYKDIGTRMDSHVIMIADSKLLPFN